MNRDISDNNAKKIKAMTTTTYRYSLDKSSKKFDCPNCKKKRLVCYLDVQTKNYLASHVGRCDREQNCAYHITPRMFFEDNPVLKKKPNFLNDEDLMDKEKTNYIPPKIMQQSLKRYKQNHFVDYLKSLFSDSITKSLIARFKIGTSKKWKGANVFWQIDHLGNVRQAKIMLYSPTTGKRIKMDEYPHKGRAKIHFAGKAILKKAGINNPNLKQCFYGEHQLSYNLSKTIGVVESEKTAILMSVLQPDLIWLATGGKNGCKWTSVETNYVLRKRKVILFPDLGCYKEWNEKAIHLTKLGYSINTTDLLEKNATESDIKQGYDLADYFIKRDKNFDWALSKNDYPIFWD